MIDEALAEVAPPSRYIEKVRLGTGEVMDEEIRPEQLLVRKHRDYHVVDVYSRYLMSRLVKATGDEEKVRETFKKVRQAGFEASNVLARALGADDPQQISRRLFGLKPREYYFRYKKDLLPAAEIRTRLDRLKREAEEKMAGRTSFRVLLTGGTGFVGKEILWQAAHHPLLEEVVVLIRPSTVRDRKTGEVVRTLSARERGEDLLRQLWLDDPKHRSRFRFLAGDIEQPRLGVDEEEFARLRSSLTHVIHCAASVAFDDPYEESFRANVLGSLNALEFSLALQEAPESPFVAHLSIETSYIHGRQTVEPAREDHIVFPRNFYNNYYELTKAMASLETERFMLEKGLRVVQLCPAIVIGEARTGNNRGDLKVVNAPVNLFGRASLAVADTEGDWVKKSQAWMLGQMATFFPADPSARLNLIPVDWVASGILAALTRPRSVGERVHLATDRRITAEQMVQIVREEIGIKVKLSEPTMHRNVQLPILTRVITGLKQPGVAIAMERLGTIFGGYSEWGQPLHEVGHDVKVLGLSDERPDTPQAFRMLCRHNRFVQQFGKIRDLDEISRRERLWADFVRRLERVAGRPAGEIPAESFQQALAAAFDLETLTPREAEPPRRPAPARGRPVPLAHADAAWLKMEDPTNLMMITGLFLLDGPMDPARLRSALEERFLAYDRFRMRAVFPAGGGRPNWEFDPDFDLDRHLLCCPAPHPEDGDALLAMVSELMSTPLEPDRPLWQFHLVQGFRGGSALVARLHHAIADGWALVRVLLSMTSTSPDLPPPEPQVRRHERRGRITWRHTAQLFQEGLEMEIRPRDFFEAGRKRVVAAADLGRMLLETEPATPLKGQLGLQKRAAVSRPLPLERIREVRQAAGVTVNDVLMATLASAVRRYLAERGAEPPEGLDIRCVVPLDLRTPGDDGLGNRFGLIFLSLPLGPAGPLERLAEVKRRMDALKASPQAVMVFGLLSAVAVAPPDLQQRVVELFGAKATAVVTNVPGPTETLYLAGRAISSLMFWVPQSGRLGLGVSILSYAGQVRVGVASDAGLIPDPNRLAGCFEEAFEELAAAVREAKG